MCGESGRATLQRVEERRCDNSTEGATKKGAGRRRDVCECPRATFGPVSGCWSRKGDSTDLEKEEDPNPILPTTGGGVTTTDVVAATLERCCEALRGTSLGGGQLGRM